MLARSKLSGVSDWIHVISSVIGSLSPQWGPWVTGQWEPDEDVRMKDSFEDSDEEEEAIVAARQTVTRAPLPTVLQNRIFQLAAPTHLELLISTVTSASAPPSAISAFSTLAMVLLRAFKATAKADTVLSVIFAGSRGKSLQKLLWRSVRPHWPTGEGSRLWATFQESKSRPSCLSKAYIRSRHS